MTSVAQNASAGVYISDDVGLEVADGVQSRVQLGLLPVGINNYGLRVVAADGTTVIIDGSSDVFKIAASGTSTMPTAAANTDATSSIQVNTGFTYRPAMLVYMLSTNALLLPYTLINITTGAVVTVHSAFCQTSGPGNQTTVIFDLQNANSGPLGGQSVKYYILQEAAL
ncbi:MAG: hypothetical protein NVS9B8_16510 [Candidatus Limnocylindrales bacterium]